MRKNIICAALMAATTATAQVALPTTDKATSTRSLAGKWDFKYIAGGTAGNDSLFFQPAFDTRGWPSIQVPGNWELQGFAKRVYHKKVKEGLGLYRRSMSIPAGWNGRSIFLSFEGVNFGYTFYIDGKEIGTFHSSFNRQTFDISKYVRAGQTHCLAVRVSTHPRGFEFDTNDDWSLAGISRDIILFSLPRTHIDDVTINTRTNGEVSIETDIAGLGKKDKAQIEGELLDAQGRQAGVFSTNATAGNRHSAVVTVKTPKLWTAETPYLYKLNMRVKVNGQTVQTYTDNVGIREIAWNDGIYRINGKPVKFHGATHHDLSPLHGRSITEAEMLHDLKMMKKANMNFLRTSHYPPAPRLLELCDSIGMYVMCEVPFGFGEAHLKDSTFLDDLKKRAYLTLRRDKNRPSVVVWSVGNENPVTDICLKTGLYVAELDSTRPFTFPMAPSVYKNWATEHKKFDAEHGFNTHNSPYIVSPHYPVPEEVASFARMYDRPMLATEYAHALGTSFGQLQDIYETMVTTPSILGGSIWEFFDQGVLVKSEKPLKSKYEYTHFVWQTPDTYYDTADNQGTDGITYADRTPQTDYYQTRKVYSNVIIRENPLRVLNRFDFTNLADVSLHWQLMGDGRTLDEGTANVTCAPHDSTLLDISPRFPQPLTASKYWLNITATDKNGYQFYEKSVMLTPANAPQLISRVTDGEKQKVKVKKGIVTTDRYSFDTGNLSLRNASSVEIIRNMVIARVGRKMSMSEKATRTSRRSAKLHKLWDKHLLDSGEVRIIKSDKKGCTYSVRLNCDAERYVDGTIALEYKQNGAIGYSFDLTAHGKDETVESGITLMLPKTMTQLRYLGNGPYAAYPGCDRLSEYGLWNIASGDLYYPGNRQHVDMAVLSDTAGNGFAIVTDDADIAVENLEHGIAVSFNTFVASAYNKYTWPKGIAQLDGMRIKGNFDIIPLTKEWNKDMQSIFGRPDGKIPVFMPFYHAYDL